MTPVGVAPAADAGAVTANRLRTVTDFDPGWLFHYGDASGAGAASYPDAGWRKTSVPDDWSVEGPNPPADPFSSSAPSTTIWDSVLRDVFRHGLPAPVTPSSTPSVTESPRTHYREPAGEIP